MLSLEVWHEWRSVGCSYIQEKRPPVILGGHSHDVVYPGSHTFVSKVMEEQHPQTWCSPSPVFSQCTPVNVSDIKCAHKQQDYHKFLLFLCCFCCYCFCVCVCGCVLVFAYGLCCTEEGIFTEIVTVLNGKQTTQCHDVCIHCFVSGRMLIIWGSTSLHQKFCESGCAIVACASFVVKKFSVSFDCLV